MHKCVVCGNTYKKTSVNRPRVIYHGFPKDECMRKKWLQVLKIDRCYDWHRVCSDHFSEKNYKPRRKRFLFKNTIPQPYGYSSKYDLLSNDVETGNISPRRSSTLTTENMSNKNKPIPTLRSGLRCSIKNCFNRLSKNLSLFGYPKDFKLRKKWIEKCGIKNDPSEIVTTGIRVCSTHFEPNCFKNSELKNRLKRGAVPSLFLDNGPNDLPGSSIVEVPVLSAICEDQFITTIDKEVAEQSLKEKQNNVKGPNDLPGSSIVEVPVLSAICEDQFTTTIDNEVAEQSSEKKQNNEKDNTSMTIDLTIDDSSNDSLSITLEPIEKRTSQCVIMDVSNTGDLTRDGHGIIFDMSKKVKLPSIFWKWEQHPIAKTSTRFCEQNSRGETVKIVNFSNNRVPIIEVYGKRYEHTTPITTNKELDELLEKVDSFEKCRGRGGFVFKQCLGYFEDTSTTIMCSGCQGLVQDKDLQRMRAKCEAEKKELESFDKRMAEKIKIILKKRKEMEEIKRKRQLDSL